MDEDIYNNGNLIPPVHMQGKVGKHHQLCCITLTRHNVTCLLALIYYGVDIIRATY